MSTPHDETRDSCREPTRERLLNVAETLFLENGLDDVSLRTIVRRAGQKNQSALQYHFGGREGLIAAIRSRRVAQVELRRRALLNKALTGGCEPELRDVCAVLTRAPFALCREDRTFRAFLGMFGKHVLASDRELVLASQDDQQPSLAKLGEMLMQRLEHLEPALLMLRLENAHTLILLAISRRARRGGSFRGRKAELFFNNMVDQMTAMLAAPVSEATQGVLDADKRSRA